jgi:phospho-N-acetylmuramoyl-pentapeptide-transferase
MNIINVIKILLPTALAFLIGIGITPTLTNFMYKHKLWRRKARSEGETITNTDFAKLNNSTAETSTPRVGGVIIWLSVLIAIALMWAVSRLFPSDISSKLDFYSRNQTLIPLASLMFGSLLGLLDDFFEIRGREGVTHSNDKEIRFRYVKIALICIVGLIIGAWFYVKLGMTGIAIPFSTAILPLGTLFIPFFILVMVAVFSGGVIDGMDGLAGGVLAIIFAAYAIIAAGQNQIDIAALCGVIAGAILAFLWFNIPPARFYMGETGMMGLLVVLTVVAFLTDTVLLLPLIALPLVVSSASSLIQIFSYKYCGKRRVFRVAPLHHHFHAIGWSREKIVMRYWVVSIIVALLGVVIALSSK